MNIQPFIPNMDISRTVLEGHWDNTFIDTARKVAIYTIIPITLIIFVEAVLKNMIFITLANAFITLINAGQELYESLKRTALDCLGY